MNVLLTGGAGFIGSHCAIDLLNQGHDVALVDNFSNCSRQTISRIETVAGKQVRVFEADLRVPRDLRDVLNTFKPSAVIHLAALKSVAESVESPLLYYQNNVTGTLNLLEEMEGVGCKRLVFSSSATVYGSGSAPPYSENAPIEPANPYGRSKVVIEEILQDVARSDSSWSIGCLRYFNPVGAHHSGLLGEEPRGVPANLFPYLFQVVAGHLPHINVFGTDYETPDGSGVRDYLHIEDLAAGHSAAIGKVAKDTGFFAVNLGTGIGYSVFEVLAAVEDVTGRKITVNCAPRRPGDVGISVADVRLARELLNWEAANDLSKMCEDSWRWYQREIMSAADF